MSKFQMYQLQKQEKSTNKVIAKIEDKEYTTVKTWARVNNMYNILSNVAPNKNIAIDKAMAEKMADAIISVFGDDIINADMRNIMINKFMNYTIDYIYQIMPAKKAKEITDDKTMSKTTVNGITIYHNTNSRGNKSAKLIVYNGFNIVCDSKGNAKLKKLTFTVAWKTIIEQTMSEYYMPIYGPENMMLTHHLVKLGGYSHTASSTSKVITKDYTTNTDTTKADTTKADAKN